jgi:hypothetical protein
LPRSRTVATAHNTAAAAVSGKPSSKRAQRWNALAGTAKAIAADSARNGSGSSCRIRFSRACHGSSMIASCL